MGYFSNGTEGEIYQDRYCRRCVHYGPEEGPGCPGFGAHLAFNYGQSAEVKEIMDSLIPPGAGRGNEQCKMFYVGRAGA